MRAALPVTDVWPTDVFASMTARYWLMTTGAGLALVVGGGLGIVVGIAIVAQTLYAATIERLPEYATLVAMGAPNRYLNRIVLRQGLISGVIGYLIGSVSLPPSQVSGDTEEKTRSSEQNDQRYDQRFFTHAVKPPRAKSISTEIPRCV